MHGELWSVYYLFRVVQCWDRMSELVYICLNELAFPGGSDGKESACNVGDPGSILDLEDPLEKGLATLSRIIARRIPWTEEAGGLQFTGSQRVGH